MAKSPIVLFVYNRPNHTKRTLDALAANREAGESELFVFCDGPKPGADAHTLSQIKAVQEVVAKENRFKNTSLSYSDTNKGLAASIIGGVTRIVNEYDTVIVLEDDIVVSEGFLKYMNDALSFYKNNSKVMHISGYMYPHNQKLPETFFFNTTLCWGWATWKDAWGHFNPSSEDLWNRVNAKGLFPDLDAFGSDYLSRQLAHNITGELRTWFIKWNASVLLNDGLTLFPGTSLVNNIGFDNTGVHNGENPEFIHKSLATSVSVNPIEEKLDASGSDIIRSFYAGLVRKSSTSISKTLKSKAKHMIYKLVPQLKKLKERYLDVKLINSHIGNQAKVYPRATLINSVIGNYTYVSENASFKNTVVGKFCSIGPNLVSGWGIHPTTGVSTHPMFYSTGAQNGMTLSATNKIEEFAPIRIGNDVFVGMNVSILDGVTIGDGAIIGAGAVVSKDIPDYAIAVGNPIQIIKHRCTPEQIEKLKALEWWNMGEDVHALVEKHFDDVDQFIEVATQHRNNL